MGMGAAEANRLKPIELTPHWMRHARKHAVQEGHGRPVTPADWASAHHMLNRGGLSKSGDTGPNGEPRVIAVAVRHGQRFEAVFQINKRTIALTTMYVAGPA